MDQRWEIDGQRRAVRRLLARHGFAVDAHLIHHRFEARLYALTSADLGFEEAVEELRGYLALTPISVVRSRHRQANGRFIFRFMVRATMWEIVLAADRVTVFNAYLHLYED